MLKKLAAVFVLIIFLAHFASFYIYFFTQLSIIRKEMRARLKELPPEELELLILSPAQFQAAKIEEHEVKVDGKMYDIARIEVKEGTIHVYCLHDKAEDNLLAFVDKILTLPLKDKNVPVGVLQFLSLNYLPAQWSFFSPALHALQSFTPYAEILQQFVSAKITPPPKV
jgi:hypothetical protein